MVIVRLHLRIRMVTKGYRKGVYDWVAILVWRGRLARERFVSSFKPTNFYRSSAAALTDLHSRY